MQQYEVLIFAACFGVAASAGLSQLLRSAAALDLRNILAAFFCSGMAGLIVGLLWFNFFKADNLYLLIGVAGLAGVGNASVLDFLCQLLAGQVGLSIKIDKGQDDKKG